MILNTSLCVPLGPLLLFVISYQTLYLQRLNSDFQEALDQLIPLLFIIPGVALSVYLVLCALCKVSVL